MKRLALLLLLGGCQQDDYTMQSRRIDGVAVPYVTPAAAGPVAFDVFPNGHPVDFSPNTGAAWIDVVSTDVRADGRNYEALRLGVMADGTAHVGAAHGGTGQQRNLLLQRSGGETVVGGGLRVRLAAPASASAACDPGELAWDAAYSYVCVSPDRWRRARLEEW
jgi:hypothetical protein